MGILVSIIRAYVCPQKERTTSAYVICWHITSITYPLWELAKVEFGTKVIHFVYSLIRREVIESSGVSESILLKERVRRFSVEVKRTEINCVI